MSEKNILSINENRVSCLIRLIYNSRCIKYPRILTHIFPYKSTIYVLSLYGGIRVSKNPDSRSFMGILCSFIYANDLIWKWEMRKWKNHAKHKNTGYPFPLHYVKNSEGFFWFKDGKIRTRKNSEFKHFPFSITLPFFWTASEIHITYIITKRNMSRHMAGEGVINESSIFMWYFMWFGIIICTI